MKFSGHVQNGTRKKYLDFGCDPDHCLDLLGGGLCSLSAFVSVCF